jgi:alpha-glucosidase (family GH31 glycosyl hydrolase)
MHNFADFTLDHENWADLGTQMTTSEQHHNVHFAIKLEPGLPMQPGYFPYEQGVSQGLLVKDWKGDPLIGSGAGGDVVYPDFYNYQTQTAWKQWLNSTY